MQYKVTFRCVHTCLEQRNDEPEPLGEDAGPEQVVLLNIFVEDITIFLIFACKLHFWEDIEQEIQVESSFNDSSGELLNLTENDVKEGQITYLTIVKIVEFL